MRYFIKFNPSKEFVEKLYRIEYIKKSDGNVFESLQFYGEQGGWHWSESFGHKVPEFISSEFTKEITKEEMDAYLKGESDS